jgi:uncharacterized membrane protein YphA (DoxX/SURF4 family)
MLLTLEWCGVAVIKAAEDHTTVRIALAALLIIGSALVLAGFMTTVGSFVVGSIEGIWAVLSALNSIADSSNRWLYPLFVVGALATLILAGPGGFSLDAYFFGPKRVEIPTPNSSSEKN